MTGYGPRQCSEPLMYCADTHQTREGPLYSLSVDLPQGTLENLDLPTSTSELRLVVDIFKSRKVK